MVFTRKDDTFPWLSISLPEAIYCFIGARRDRLGYFRIMNKFHSKKIDKKMIPENQLWIFSGI